MENLTAAQQLERARCLTNNLDTLSELCHSAPVNNVWEGVKYELLINLLEYINPDVFYIVARDMQRKWGL